MASLSEIAVGQLFVIEGHRPEWGRSDDGAVGRIVANYKSTPDPWGLDYVYVDLFRRHRTTGRPLKLKEFHYYPIKHMRIVEESQLTHEQRELIAYFAMEKVLRTAEAAKNRQGRIAWMRSLGGDWPEVSPADIPQSERSRFPEMARIGIAELERILLAAPSEIDSAQLVAFFHKHRAALEAQLVDVLELELLAGLFDQRERAARKGSG